MTHKKKLMSNFKERNIPFRNDRTDRNFARHTWKDKEIGTILYINV
jgi:hypothetical protein